MKSDTQLIKQFNKHRSSTVRGLASQYDNTINCQSYYAGDTNSYRDYIQFTDTSGLRRRAMVQFNKVKPYVNAVKGFAAQNRRKAKYSARLDSPLQIHYTKYVNAMSDYTREKANADQVETQQDGDMLINGYGAIEEALTYNVGRSTTDPNGQILMGRLDPLKVGWDPYAVATNLLDARWVFYEQIYALQDAVELFDSPEEDFDTNSDSMDNGNYEWYERGGRLNKIKESNLDWSDERQELAKVFFYQWYEFETFYRADNPIFKLNNPQAVQLAALQLDAIAQEFNEDEQDMFTFDPRAEILNFNDKIKTRLMAHFGEFIKPVPFKRKVYYTAVLSGEHVFTKYKSQSQQGFSIKFKTGDYDARNKIWVGMVNSMMDPQLYYNKALTEIMFTIGANSKGGVMYETGTIEDIQDFEAKYAKTDANVEVAAGALMEGRIRPKREPFQPSGYEEIVQISNESLADVSGIDKGFLGSSENRGQETGILQKRRIRQVVAGLACYFDSITLYQKEEAELRLDYMREWAANNDGGLVGVLGEGGKEEFLYISEDKFVPNYDITIQEAPQTPEDKQEFAEILVSMADKLASVGDLPTAKILYAMAVKYTPLDQEDIMKLTQVLMPQDQKIDPAYVEQLEQKIQMLSSEITQAEVRSKMSKAMLDMARVDEVKAKIPGYHAETSRTEQEALQTGLENQLISSGKATKVSVSA